MVMRSMEVLPNSGSKGTGSGQEHGKCDPIVMPLVQLLDLDRVYGYWFRVWVWIGFSVCREGFFGMGLGFRGLLGTYGSSVLRLHVTDP